MFTDDSTSTITVRRSELLDAIAHNRAQHREIFMAAQTGYREAVLSELDRMLELARSNKEIRQSVGLPPPEDHTRDYDRVIRMLQMCTSDLVQVTEAEFSHYVMDEWGWKRAWVQTSERYAQTPIPQSAR